MADIDSFMVTWADPAEPSEWPLIAGWLRAHGLADRYLVEGLEPCVASHPLLGDVLVYSGPQRDARGRLVLALGSATEYARRVHVLPLGMPPPPALHERGEARARSLGLRLPVAALLSGKAS